jgi:hypothetical protein
MFGELPENGSLRVVLHTSVRHVIYAPDVMRVTDVIKTLF